MLETCRVEDLTAHLARCFEAVVGFLGCEVTDELHGGCEAVASSGGFYQADGLIGGDGGLVSEGDVDAAGADVETGEVQSAEVNLDGDDVAERFHLGGRGTKAVNQFTVEIEEFGLGASKGEALVEEQAQGGVVDIAFGEVGGDGDVDLGLDLPLDLLTASFGDGLFEEFGVEIHTDGGDGA